jgi:hypothetical protein
MEKQYRWVKRAIKCPEGRGESGLFLEWRVEGGEEILNSISCNNPELRDLSGRDCEWSCWERVSPEKE